MTRARAGESWHPYRAPSVGDGVGEIAAAFWK
jgi:hypothetical protein